MRTRNKSRRAWLCLNPVRLKDGDVLMPVPCDCLHLLAVYKTKKQGREIHGLKAEFIAVEMKVTGK